MFEKIPASNRWISLKGKDLLEGKDQIKTTYKWFLNSFTGE